MQNKIKNIKKCFFMAAAMMAFVSAPVFAADAPKNIDEWAQQALADAAADDIIMDADAEAEWAEEISSDAVAEYQIEGTLFQRIADLEQEKVLMQLEKERATLDLELDRLAAEKIKLAMEIDTLSGRAEEQQLELDAERAKLEAETVRLEREKQALEARAADPAPARTSASVRQTASAEESAPAQIAKKYRLVDIIGAGNQLQATVEDSENGQRKKISVGKTLDSYTIKSISLDDGVVFVKDGVSETLNIGKESK